MVRVSVERLYYYIVGDAAELLCLIALRCIDPDPQQRPCIDWVLAMLKSVHKEAERNYY